MFVAAALAICAGVSGQNDAAPAAPAAPAGQPTNAPAAPAAAPDAQPGSLTNAPVAAPTNAPTVVEPINSAVLPSAALSTNSTAAALELARTNNASEVVPLIVIDDVPLIDAVKNLARQAGLNYIPDPKLLSVSNQPNVTLRLENITAQDALLAVLKPTTFRSCMTRG